ncbi:hypothetical protein PS1_034597 [Malus domestica]
MTDLHANLEADANQVPKSRVLAFESKAEPDLSVTVNGLHMPNPFVIGLPPWTNYTVMKRAFDEGWGAAIAKTVSLVALFLFHLDPEFELDEKIVNLRGWIV